MAGYPSALLQISVDKSLKSTGRFAVDLNHAASIQLGKLVERHWILLDEVDKKFIRDNIMQAICSEVENKQIQKQYTRTLKQICIDDYPKNFPNLFPGIMSFLRSKDLKQVYTGL